MGSRILVATLPGMVLSDIISDFRIWNTGNIFLLDEEGIIIADVNPSLVQERRSLRDVTDTVVNVRGSDDFLREFVKEEPAQEFTVMMVLQG
jgi:hypothetical protein